MARRRLWVPVAALAVALAPPVAAQILPSYGPTDTIVLTDPLVRTIQLGYTPVGTLVAVDPRTRVGTANLPSVGVRRVRLVGQPAVAGGAPVSVAVDLLTGVEMLVWLPASRESLVPATVVRATQNGITVRRQGAPRNESEILPRQRIAVMRNGTPVSAAVAGVRLAPGAAVLIPSTGGARTWIRREPVRAPVRAPR